MFRHFPKAVKSITLVNETEFADHKTIAKRLNATVYFAHPHSPWDKKIAFCALPQNGQRPLTRSRSCLAVFSEELEGRLHRSVPRGLPTEN